MLKVMTIIGTRPELIKMSRVIAAFDQHTNHILVHTGQNFDYELNQVFFDDLEIRKPNHFLEVAGSNTAQTIGAIIEKADQVMALEKPDALLLYGDTNSCLAVIAAKRRQIPIFHMEAGNRCFDQRVPEEINRKVLDHLSDMNLVLSEHARRYLLAEGIPGDRIIKTGSHMQEVLDHYKTQIECADIDNRLGLQPNQYFLVSAHREENVDSTDNLQALLKAISELAEEYQLPIIISTHPRTRLRLEALDNKFSHNKVSFLKPFGFFDYIKLQMGARCILSDSGTLTEEAALLNLPAVMIRSAHERPEGMDAGTVIMSGLNPHHVKNAVKVTLQQHSERHFSATLVTDYQVEQVSQKILRIVLSYTDFINRVVWSK